MTNPGDEKLIRVYDKKSGKIRADLIVLQQKDELLALSDKLVEDL
ncbi:MAG: hypothetical protein CI948_756 [Halanaerobium sp.]|jgi:nicotinate phosphoribosyltransferase|nr:MULTISPECIES: hypothetical protein [Halanaerobium]KXS49149.1 MAG: hypothetical protein AWL62_1321 [Halanaerobium sp. T82-1]PUU87434.1 MAG: hypothetical protein CI949_3557 [Halanaerobium sp.]PUU92234.1 MAG: hypothetical protein CI948_756 [Halanaerobium sp.]